MFKNLLKKRAQKGFTIIEVMIVLAIAGLILVVVLVAVPQLQRNQRNSARRNDAARVATAISNWVSNNNGAIYDGGVAANETSVLNDLGGTSQYNLTAASLEYATGTQGALSSLTNVRVITGAKCGANGASTVTGAAPRQFVVQYSTENNTGTPQGQCIEV